MTSMSLGADAQEVKANVLEFIEKYGCEVAPDEAFDALAEAFQPFFGVVADGHIVFWYFWHFHAPCLNR